MNINTLSPLFTDQYELVMAQGYWQMGNAEQESVFELYFRRNPFEGHYTICCGLERVIELLQNFQFTQEDIAYLSQLKMRDQTPLFKPEFLHYLANLTFNCDVDAIPEGTLVFVNEPLIRIRGPLVQCQILETSIINFINFSSLIATKATHVVQAALHSAVVEFGARRAQGPDGALMASRAAYIGGCIGTSNMLAGKIYQIPTYGTQAHSWVMTFADEMVSFREFAQMMKNNTVLLVDTYDTLQGVQHAITVGQEMRARGENLFAIRLDSGDLAILSKKARKMLDAAGFENTKIMASGELDEQTIMELTRQDAPIDLWGVGTRLITAADQPFLDIVYKLTAIRRNKTKWQYKIKISADQPEKSTTPGIHQVRRYYNGQQLVSDVIYDIEFGVPDEMPIEADRYEDLLVPIFRQGKLIYSQPTTQAIREFCNYQCARFADNKILPYAVRLESRLQALKQELSKGL